MRGAKQTLILVFGEPYNTLSCFWRHPRCIAKVGGGMIVQGEGVRETPTAPPILDTGSVQFRPFAGPRGQAGGPCPFGGGSAPNGAPILVRD
jgi:hypothetical protein